MRRSINIIAAIAAVAASVLICAGCGKVESPLRSGGSNDGTKYTEDEQTTADSYAQECYQIVAEYLVDEFTQGRHNDAVVNDGDFADAMSSEGLKFNKDSFAKGEQYLYDTFKKSNKQILDGTLFITFDIVDGVDQYDYYIVWVSPTGSTGEYSKQSKPDISDIPAEEADQSEADRTAKIYYAAAAEYLDDQITSGRSVETVFEEGDFFEAVSDNGLVIGGEHTSAGDTYLTEYADLYDIKKYKGTVYITVNSYDTENGYDMTVIWEGLNGMRGQYPVNFDVSVTDDTEHTDQPDISEEAVTLTQANANAKSFYNCLAEYLADEYTKGRPYPTVLAEGDLAEAVSEEGLLLDGEHSGAGDSFLADTVSVFDIDMRRGRVFAGFDVVEGMDEFDFFVQWMSEDGVIGQYPTPIREEYKDEVVFGTFCER